MTAEMEASDVVKFIPAVKEGSDRFGGVGLCHLIVTVGNEDTAGEWWTILAADMRHPTPVT